MLSCTSVHDILRCLPRSGPITTEQYFAMLYSKPHSPSWALGPQDSNGDTTSRVSASKEPLVSRKVDKWPYVEDMGTRKFYVTNLEPSCHKPRVLTKQELNSLFEAVELSWYSKVCSLVTSPGLDINGINDDGMTPLDTALLLGDTPVARVLQHHGATESARYSEQPGLRQQHVLALLHEAEMQRTNVITNPLNTPLPNNSPEVKSDAIERKLWKYHSMLSTLKKTSLPRVPVQFVVSVVSGTSVRVECYEPVDNRSSLVTQYKIEWSTCPKFQSCVCTEIITAGHHMSHVINGLNKGTSYYFVVQAGNIKGFGGSSNVKKCTPSHWADNKGVFDELQDMSTGANMLNLIRNNFNAIFPQMFAQTPTKSKTRARTLSRLFTTPKFVKTLQRCLYLTVLHFVPGGKVLVTDSDQLPTVQVDDLATSNTVESELMWFFKLAMAGWPNFKDLKEELNTHQEMCGVSVRLNLVTAALYLQEYLGMSDLGIPYYRIVKKNGVMIILLIKISETISAFNGVHTKFASPSSLDINCVNPKDALDIVHLNMLELQVLYSRLLQPPTPGLYVGIISFRVKNEELEIVVDKGCPLLPPLEYVREVSNVTEEEWNTLKGENQDDSNLLCKQVGAAVSALLVRLNGSDEDVSSYSLYTASVVEIGETSIMLIIPPELVSPLGQENGTEGTITIPLHTYEIFLSHQKHSRLCETLLHCSTNINTCQLLLSQKMRQTICNDEVLPLKEARLKLDKLYESLSTIWSKYSYCSEVLSQCVNETVILRKMSDILHSVAESPASSITEGDPVSDKLSGVIRIYNSVELGSGPPCIKLHITGGTTCRDVVNSVVRKVRRQQDLLPPLDVELQALGLVATLDNISQFIPDHFQLLRLGSPWSTAKLHVRFKSTTI